MSLLNPESALQSIEQSWLHATPNNRIESEYKISSSDVTIAPGNGILKSLFEYISIPNQSPQFDSEWATNGLQEKAIAILVEWIKIKQGIVANLKYKVISESSRTPAIFITIDPFLSKASKEETILMYGHMDKQPPLLPWAKGLHPHKPVLRDGKLYGRGGADGTTIYNNIQMLLFHIDDSNNHA